MRQRSPGVSPVSSKNQAFDPWNPELAILFRAEASVVEVKTIALPELAVAGTAAPVEKLSHDVPAKPEAVTDWVAPPGNLMLTVEPKKLAARRVPAMVPDWNAGPQKSGKAFPNPPLRICRSDWGSSAALAGMAYHTRRINSARK